MEKWKQNLWICCGAGFIVSIGMSQLAPMLPLYISTMGVTATDDIERLSGIIYGCNFISLAVFSPIWGRLSDRYGRKPMVMRASLWLSFIMAGMGLAQSVYQLAALRLAQGAMSGFQAAVIPLIAQESPKEHSGWLWGCFLPVKSAAIFWDPCWAGGFRKLSGFAIRFSSLDFFAFSVS